MKQKKTILTSVVATVLLSVMLAQFISCEKYVLPELTISQDTIIFKYTVDSVAFEVHSNVIWEIETPELSLLNPWVKAMPNWAEGSATVIFKTQLNEGPERKAKARVFSETIERHLLLIQQAAPQPQQDTT